MLAQTTVDGFTEIRLSHPVSIKDAIRVIKSILGGDQIFPQMGIATDGKTEPILSVILHNYPLPLDNSKKAGYCAG